VLRLYDTRTGQAQEIKPVPGGPLRLQVRGLPGQRPVHIGDLRVLVVADLIRRDAEHRHNLACLLTIWTPDAASSGAYGDGLHADAAALNLSPAEQTDPEPGPADPVGSGEVIVGTCRVRAGQVLFDGREIETTDDPVRLPDLAEHGLDPLALRLAFLRSRYREPVNLTWDVLSQTDQTIRQWRERVAEWAESPSKPMRPDVTARISAALDDDLDTPAALRALAGLERDPAVPAGSKFETFAHADQLLALDLSRDIGRPPSSRNNSPS